MTDDTAKILREHGVEVTAQRSAVLWTVSGRPHFMVEDVAENVIAKIGTILRQVVYYALGLLPQKGLSRRIQPTGSSALYEDRVADNHQQVICRTCGKTVNLDFAVGETPCLTAADSGYQIDEAEVICQGTCPEYLAAYERSGGRNPNKAILRNHTSQLSIKH